MRHRVERDDVPAALFVEENARRILTAVEEALAGAFPQYGLRCQIAIVTRSDEDKGEALIAVSNESKLTLDEIRAVIRGKSFTNLCVPREIRYLREIPKLGTGKVNHRELQRVIDSEPASAPSSSGHAQVTV